MTRLLRAGHHPAVHPGGQHARVQRLGRRDRALRALTPAGAESDGRLEDGAATRHCGGGGGGSMRKGKSKRLLLTPSPVQLRMCHDV